MIKKSLTLRILAINFLFLALPLLIDSFIFFQNSYYEEIQSAKNELREASNVRKLGLVASQPAKRVLLSELGYVIDINAKMAAQDFESLTHELKKIGQLWENYQIYVLKFGKGGFYKIVAASDEKLINTYFEAYHPLDTVLQTGYGTFIRYLFSDEIKEYESYLFVAQTIHDKEVDKPVGVLMFSSNIEDLLASLTAPSHQLRNAKFAILNSDGVVFKSTDPRLMGNYFKPISDIRRKQIRSTKQLGYSHLSDTPLPVIHGKDPPFFEFIFDDQVQIAYQIFIPEMNLSLVGYSPKEEFFGIAVRHFLFIYATYGLIMLGGGAIAYMLSIWISRPLRQLIHVMGEVRQGNLKGRFQEVDWGFEINVLGSRFNSMIDTLLLNMQRAEDERVKKETYQRELEICREVQQSLLSSRFPQLTDTTLPQFNTTMASGLYLPAVEVGGDFFYFFSKTKKSGEEVLGLSVADVNGRGISPCMYSLSARSLFRAYTTLHDDVATIMNLTNEDFIRDIGDNDVNMNLFFGFYYINSCLLSYCPCGFVPALIKKKNGQIFELGSTSAALGLNNNPEYKSSSCQLYPGDTLIIYTNGLLKTIDNKGNPFSEMQLRAILESKKWDTAQVLVDEIKMTLQEFTAGTPQDEEVVIVVLQID